MEKISVCIRVRPLDKQEAAKGSPWNIADNTIAFCNASGVPLMNQVYTFDSVFGNDSTNLDIYKATTKDIVSSAVKGFNGTVFAYGQTSSGKTYTMRGTCDELGIIPLAIHDVFRNLEEAVDREFLLRMSYMEIYNEEINDLLAPEQRKLQVHESLERGVFVAGLREEIVASPEQVLQLMEFGEAQRHVGETNMNVYSSRSHTIFRMVIESRDRSQDEALSLSCDAVRVSVLNLVDLAGSERIAKTGAEGARLKEGTHINKSLMTLGNVINKLSEGIESQGGHVPYRDSKLTRILQPALGGNARTAVICNITPAMVHADESRGTLQFASRAIRVTNCAKVNEILTDAALLKRQKKEIEELRCKLKESHSEHFEEEILNLRNTLLKSESERERIALELQEEKRVHAERERQQAQKIENLSTMVLNSTIDERDFEKRMKKNSRRETWCPRIPLENILDEDHSRPVKENLRMWQNRDRGRPLPPPFESLLEEYEVNTTEQVHAHEGSAIQGMGNVSDEKESDREACVMHSPSTDIHVAERKRKYLSEVAMADERTEETDLQKEYIDARKGSHKSRKLGLNNLHPQESERRCKSLEGYLEDSSLQKHLQEELLQENNQAKADALKYKHELTAVVFELEQMRDLNAKLETSLVEAEQLAKSSQQNLEATSKELVGVLKELKATESELELAREEYKLMSQHVHSMKDSHGFAESSVDDPKKEKEDLALQLTEVCLQLEEERAAWAVKEKSLLLAKETEKKLRTEELAYLAKEVARMEEHVSELDCCNNKIVGLQKRLESCNEMIKHLEFCKKINVELQNEALTANAVAEEERIARERKSVEAAALQEKVIQLKMDVKQEKALRELKSREVSELRKKLSCLEDAVDRAQCNENTYLEERMHLLTENLKLQVGIDAISANADIFHGRLLEAGDEVKILQKVLDHSKRTQEKLEHEVSNLKMELSTSRMRTEINQQGPQQNKQQNQRFPQQKPPDSGLHRLDESNNQIAKRSIKMQAHGIKQGRLPSNVANAHTVCLPVGTEDFTMEESMKGHTMPILLHRKENIAVDNNKTTGACEIAELSGMKRGTINLVSSSGSRINLKQPQPFLGLGIAARLSIMRSKSCNKENL